MLFLSRCFEQQHEKVFVNFTVPVVAVVVVAAVVAKVVTVVIVVVVVLFVDAMLTAL